MRIHRLGSRHAGTFERALEELCIFSNAHLGHGVRNSGRADPFDDPMDLTFQAPVARHAESARHPMRSPSTSARCFNCGQLGHLLSACRLPRRAPSAQPSSRGFGQHVSRSPRTNAEVFRSDGALRRCFNCGPTGNLVQVCPSRPQAFGMSG